MPDLEEDTHVPQVDHPTVEGWEEFTRAFGEFGGVERRYAHIANLETRDNGDPESLFSTTGRAIVFNSYSLDLGGFKEEIDPEAVRNAMDADDADYHLLWDHDTTLVLARNRNGTLKAEIGDEGVDFWGRVAKTSYAADLRALMDRGDVDECSFAFTIDPDGGEEWRLEDDGTIVRRVTKIKRLWDLTICARGAYPSTHSASVRSFAAGLARERADATAETAETAEVEDRALKPGLIAWDAEQGYCDVACDLSDALWRTEGDYYTYWWVIDLNVRDGGTEAIVCRSSIEDHQYYLLQGVIYDDSGEPQLPPAENGLTAVEEMFVAVTLSGDDEGSAAFEAYTAELAERRASAVEEIKTRAHRAVDERFERANEVVGPSDDVIDVHEADDDSDDDILGHKPTSNDDENVTGFVAGEQGDEEDDADEDDRAAEDAEERDAEEAEAPETEPDEERKLAVARARAKGRAALA